VCGCSVENIGEFVIKKMITQEQTRRRFVEKYNNFLKLGYGKESPILSLKTTNIYEGISVKMYCSLYTNELKVRCLDIKILWYNDFLLHREDGPAVENWIIYDQNIYFDSFAKLKSTHSEKYYYNGHYINHFNIDINGRYDLIVLNQEKYSSMFDKLLILNQDKIYERFVINSNYSTSELGKLLSEEMRVW